MAMTSENEGTLQMQPSGRWAVCRSGWDPIEITSGDVFRVEVPGEAGLRRTRMEHMDGEGYSELADLQRQFRRSSRLRVGRYAMTELKAHAALVRERRDLAQLELVELVEMPREEMGRA